MNKSLINILGVIFIFILSWYPMVAQVSVDSLENRLKTVNGIDKVDVLNELYKAYRNNEPIKALNYTQGALQLAEKINYQKGIGISLNNLGVHYKNLGNYDDALDFYLQSLKVQQEIGNQERIGFTLSNIGVIYIIKNNFKKALESFQNALVIFEELGEASFQVKALNNIGNVYYSLNDYDQALEQYLIALEIQNTLGGKAETIDILTNIGNIYNRKNDFDEALTYYFRSLEIERENKNKFGQAHSLFNIGENYRNQANFESATNYLDQASTISKNLGDKPLLSKIYASMAEVYFATDQLMLAYLTLKRQNVIKDSVFNAESGKRLAELEALYELDKKEKENQILAKDNENKSLQNRNAQLVIFAFVFVFLFVVILAVLTYIRLVQNKQANKLLEEQNIEISRQKIIIETRNQDITDSIQYAKSVQESILRKNTILENLPQSFLFFKPKDIVSGDFYWYYKKNGFDILAAVDCTGHGVAGALLTMIGNSILNQIVIENNITNPAEILTQLDQKVMETLKGQDLAHTNHGMDVAICKLDRENKLVSFAGAKRPLYYIRDHKLIEIRGNKSAIADSLNDQNKEYKEHLVNIEKGDIFYMFSDGFSDQFGDKQNKKYMIKRFKNFLEKNHQDTMENQCDRLKMEIEDWMGDQNQTDDMLIIGFKPQL